jgi:thermitase
MSHPRRAAFCYLLALLCIAAQAQNFRANGLDCAVGRVIVVQEDGARVGQPSRHLGGRAHLLDVPRGQERAEIARLLRAPGVQLAELDCLSRPASSDPYFADEWHLARTGAPTAWGIAQGPGVTVAVLDTGVACNVADLISRCVPGWNFYDGNDNTADPNGHGTLVAGTVAATSNTIGVVGVAPLAQIMPLRIAAPDGLGYWSMIASALYYAADRGVRVANISYENMLLSSSIKAAAQYLKDRGGLVFVAAGNSGTDPGQTPSTSMIAVSATTKTDARASWSSYGPQISLTAPGLDVWTTTRTGTYAKAWGTSFSSPIAAGVAALVFSAAPALSAAEVEAALFASAIDLGVAGRDTSFGYGLVNAAGAVALATGAPMPPPPPPAPPGGTEQTKPVVTVSAPLNGMVITGLDSVTISATATDNVGVTKMVIYINGIKHAQSSGGSISYVWNLAGVASKKHYIKVIAYDAVTNNGNVVVEVIR